ncbi:MAG: hypothetical protein ISS70_17425 [Phycisphaerae bacterium]|nr:hypothetical protein [Phycisphaerae bacterium]
MYKHLATLFCFVILSPITGSAAIARQAGEPTKATDTKSTAIALEFGMLLTRGGQSAERSGRRSSYSQSDDPVHSKLVDGTLSQFRPEEDQAAGDDNQWRWKRVEFNESGGIEQRGL